MKAVLVLAVMAVVALAQGAEECPKATAMPGFKYEQFAGVWYEVGHYRNAGASNWSKDCFCSTSNVTRDDLSIARGHTIYTYDCNLESATGELQLYFALLSNMDPPGKWELTHFGSVDVAPQDFTVLSIDADSALAYRCGSYGDDGISYTAQLLGRKPTLDSTVIEKMKARVANLKLNPENAEFVMVYHGSDCTYEGH